MFLVSFHVHEVIEFALVAELDLDNPVGESVLVEQFGLIVEGFVDLHDGAADGRDEVAGGLDTFHGAEFLACGDFIVHFRHVHIDHVAQSVLSVVADTNVTKFAFYANVLV